MNSGKRIEPQRMVKPSSESVPHAATEGMMLSKRALTGLGRALRWFHVIRVSPLKWDTKNECVIATDAKFHLLSVATVMCLYVMYTVNTIWSMVERSVNDSFKGKDDLAFNLSWCWFFGTTAFAVCTMWMKMAEVSCFTNNFLLLDKRFSGVQFEYCRCNRLC